MGIKAEFDEAFHKDAGYGSKRLEEYEAALWAAKWAMEKCAKELDYVDPYIAQRFRELTKELDQ